MSLAAADLADLVAAAPFLAPEVPDRIRNLALPALKGRACNFGYPTLNVVGLARLENAAHVKRAVRYLDWYYRQLANGYSWLVAPGDTPTGLAQILKSSGFTRCGDMIAMAYRDLDTPIPAAPAVTIQPLAVVGRAGMTDFLVRAF